MRRLVPLLGCALLVLICVARATNATTSFVYLADLQLDPQYDAASPPAQYCHTNSSNTCSGNTNVPFASNNDNSLGQYGCDSPAALLTSLFAAVNASFATTPYDFVLVSGSFTAGCLENTDVDGVVAVVSNVTAMLQSTVGAAVPILPLIGPNDVFPAYQLPYGPSELLSSYWKLWSDWLPASAQETFETGGYYSVDVSSNLTVAVVNALFYTQQWCSSNTTQCVASGPNHDYQDDPSGQFAWLQQVCTEVRAAKRALLVATNIAPGVSVTYEPLWLPQYETQWLSLLQQNADVVAGIVASNSFRDTFSLYYGDSDDSDLVEFSAGSLTPRNVNNPSFRIYTFDDATQTLLDYSQSVLDLAAVQSGTQPTWQLEYTFSATYQQPNLLAESMQSVLIQLASSNTALTAFQSRYYAGCTSSALPAFPNDAYYLCAIQTSVTEEQLDCAASDGASNSALWTNAWFWWTLGLTITAILVAIVLGVFFWSNMQRAKREEARRFGAAPRPGRQLLVESDDDDYDENDRRFPSSPAGRIIYAGDSHAITAGSDESDDYIDPINSSTEGTALVFQPAKRRYLQV